MGFKVSAEVEVERGSELRWVLVEGEVVLAGEADDGSVVLTSGADHLTERECEKARDALYEAAVDAQLARLAKERAGKTAADVLFAAFAGVGS